MIELCETRQGGVTARLQRGFVPITRSAGFRASPIAKHPTTTNIKLTRATTRSLIAGRNPSREPRREYVSGRTTTSTTSVAAALKGVMKLAYNAH